MADEGVVLQPVWHFRLEDTETGEFRNVSVAASSKEEAEQIILKQEQKKVDLALNEEELADLEVLEKVSLGKTLSSAGDKERFERLVKDGNASFGGRQKARLFAHRQENAYVIQKAKEA